MNEPDRDPYAGFPGTRTIPAPATPNTDEAAPATAVDEPTETRTPKAPAEGESAPKKGR